MGRSLVVFDNRNMGFEVPEITVEVVPCGKFRWFAEFHVYFEGDIAPYHYHDLDKHFYLYRRAVRYGIDIGSDLEWFFWEYQKKYPEWTSNDYAKVLNLKELLEDPFDETKKPIILSDRK